LRRMDGPKHYRVIANKNLTYSVEVSEPGIIRRVVGFSTEDDAKGWIIKVQGTDAADG